ncbi:MAG TPA: carboxymuconolactone decarboxylase family protein [Acidimicrobiia bacterium]|jgi:alkylhydroperoxidase/carboxymuconolactone decarboxylase family protein YurZ
MTDDPYAQLASRGDDGWERVMALPRIPSTEPGTFVDLTRKLVFGDLWQRPHLNVRDRRLVTLTVLALFGRDDITSFHVGAALRSGDLGPEELEELGVQLAFYGGWPVAAAFTTLVAQEVATWRAAPTADD